VDFARIKEIRIVEVLAKRGISLRYNGEWGSAVCPLPSHKPGDKDRTFQVNTRQNYFKCWSASCNEKAGKKGGDVINLVALLENCSEYNAAKQLAEMFHIGNEKAAQHIAKRPENPANGTSKRTESNSTSPAGAVNYMASIDIWFDDTFKPLPDEDQDAYWKRARKAVKSKLIESYKAGQKSV